CPGATPGARTLNLAAGILESGHGREGERGGLGASTAPLRDRAGRDRRALRRGALRGGGSRARARESRGAGPARQDQAHARRAVGGDRLLGAGSRQDAPGRGGPDAALLSASVGARREERYELRRSRPLSALEETRGAPGAGGGVPSLPGAPPR